MFLILGSHLAKLNGWKIVCVLVARHHIKACNDVPADQQDLDQLENQLEVIHDVCKSNLKVSLVLVGTAGRICTVISVNDFEPAWIGGRIGSPFTLRPVIKMTSLHGAGSGLCRDLPEQASLELSSNMLWAD